MSFAAKLGIAAAPSLVRGIGNAFRRDKPSPYERRIKRIADVLEKDATAPLTENRFYKEGSAQIEKRSERNRDRTQNANAITGGSDEARLAATQDNNEADQDADLRLLSNAEDFKQRSRSRFLNALGLLESAKQARNQRFNQGLNNIVQPLQGASNAFLLSSIFDSPEGGNGIREKGESIADFINNTPKAQPLGGPVTSGSIFSTFDLGGPNSNRTYGSNLG